MACHENNWAWRLGGHPKSLAFVPLAFHDLTPRDETLTAPTKPDTVDYPRAKGVEHFPMPGADKPYFRCHARAVASGMCPNLASCSGREMAKCRTPRSLPDGGNRCISFRQNDAALLQALRHSLCAPPPQIQGCGPVSNQSIRGLRLPSPCPSGRSVLSATSCGHQTTDHLCLSYRRDALYTQNAASAHKMNRYESTASKALFPRAKSCDAQKHLVGAYRSNTPRPNLKLNCPWQWLRALDSAPRHFAD